MTTVTHCVGATKVAVKVMGRNAWRGDRGNQGQIQDLGWRV